MLPYKVNLACCAALLGVLTLPLVALAADTGRVIPDQVRAADDYFLGRRDLANVQKGISLLRKEVGKNPGEYEAWWRISMFSCYLARHSDGHDKMQHLEGAIDAGRKAVAIAPGRPEGHFWLGADLGLMAEARGFLRGLTLVDSIRKEMEIVIRLDPEYEQAAGFRMLARLDYRAPFFKGGDKRRSIELLEQALDRYPDNSLTMLYLADSLMALGRRDEARQQLERILNLCPDPVYGPEQEENQEEARQRLGKLRASTGR